jgi:hypothetical protein
MSFVLENENKIDSAVWAGSYDVVNVAQSELYDEVNDFKSIGVAPIVIKEGPAGVDFMVDRLLERVRSEGSIYLLRIHGHGLGGLQTVSCGINLKKDKLATMRSIISTYNFENIRNSLSRLKGSFSADAEVWLMGCYVGQYPNGPILLSKLSKLWGVPVKAGTGVQFGGALEGGGSASFGIEGAIVTATP